MSPSKSNSGPCRSKTNAAPPLAVPIRLCNAMESKKSSFTVQKMRAGIEWQPRKTD